MGDTRPKLKILRQAGRVGAELLEIDRPPVAYNCPSDDNGLRFEEDEGYWDAFSKMKQKLEQFYEVEVKTDYRDEPTPFLGLIATQNVAGDEFLHINVDYDAIGGSRLVIEYRIDGGWHTMTDHEFEEIDSVEIGRLVARAELAILANELESSTEALDYWITEESAYSKAKYSQSRWAKARKVSRQTVNQRVQSVKERLSI